MNDKSKRQQQYRNGCTCIAALLLSSSRVSSRCEAFAFAFPLHNPQAQACPASYYHRRMNVRRHIHYYYHPAIMTTTSSSSSLIRIRASLEDQVSEQQEQEELNNISAAELLYNKYEESSSNSRRSNNKKDNISSQTETIRRLDAYDMSSSFNLPYSNEISRFLRNAAVEVFFCLLVLLSSFLVAVGTLPNDGLIMSENAFDIINDIENTIVAIFTVEFFARWYGIGQFTGRYLRKPLVIIDIFVVVLPFMLKMSPGLAMMFPQFLSSDSGLITLTLLRILRLQRILKDLDTFSEIEVVLGLERSDVRPYQLAVARVILSIFTLLTVASGMIYTAEHTVNPAIPDYFTALYFGLTTLTTVGFGDITPITFPGKVVVCASILFGITVIPAQAALLVDTLFEYQKERASELEENADLSEIILIDYDDSDTIFAVDQQGNNKKNSQNGMGMDTNSIDDDVRCHVCSASSHRMDALFCWSCGTRL